MPSSLLAILLTISTHSGPQFVFHYPQHPDTRDYEADYHDNDLQEDSSSTDGWLESGDDSSVTTDDNIHDDLDTNNLAQSPKNLLETLERGRARHRIDTAQRNSSKQSEDMKRDASMAEGHDKPEQSPFQDKSHYVLGFDPDFLSELLCPPRSMCNTKFEMTIDEMSFIGLPCHVLPDGQWRRRKPRHPSSRTGGSTLKVSQTGDQEDNESEVSEEDNDQDDETEKTEESEKLENEKTENDDSSSMRMFHVVFVMNPPLSEHSRRTNLMYHNVLDPFVRTLRTEQAKSNYVWNQASDILKIKEAYGPHGTKDDLWIKLQSTCGIAQVISHLFQAIVTENIANVMINNKMRSFQLEIQREFERLPTIKEPHQKGSYLTTATREFTNLVMNNKASDYPEGVRLYGILLLAEPEQVIKNMHADASAISKFIRMISPTETIEQLATRSGRPVNKVLELAQSLVYWRQANFITPVSHKNTYAVSPLADIGNIALYNIQFKETFMELPLSLPKLLSMLSTGKPRPYASHIPSRDHRDIYVAALAWMMRKGFIIHLRAYIYVRVTKKIKLEVHKEIQAETEAGLEAVKNPKPSKNTDSSTDNTTKRGETSEESIELPKKTEKLKIGSPAKNSLSSGSESETPLVDDESMEESILLDPARATALERRWISRIVHDQPEHIQGILSSLLKYFNGTRPIDEALALEGIDRHTWKEFRSTMDEYLMLVRHW